MRASFWLVAFVLGILSSTYFSFATDALQILNFWLVLVSLLVGGFFTKNVVYRNILLACAGFYWGACHAAPWITPKDLSRGDVFSVEERDHLVSAAAPLIVKNSGQRFMVLGKQPRVGVLGSIRCFGATPHSVCMFTSNGPIDLEKTNFFSRIAHRFRRGFQRQINREPQELQDWLSLLILGEKSVLDRPTISALKNCGLYHLVIVSGMHISIIAHSFHAFLQLLLRFFYVPRLLSPGVFVGLNLVVGVVAALIVFLFALVVDMSAAVQRACAVFLCAHFGFALFGNQKRSGVWLWSAVLQSLIFPLSFLTPGNLMSWCAFILVSAPPNFSRVSVARVFSAIRVQFLLFLLTFLLFRTWAPLGLILNLVLGELFTLITLSSVTLLLFGERIPVLQDFTRSLVVSFFEFVVSADRAWSVSSAWFRWRIPANSLSVSFLIAGLVTWQLLYVFRRGDAKMRTVDESGDENGTMDR